MEMAQKMCGLRLASTQKGSLPEKVLTICIRNEYYFSSQRFRPPPKTGTSKKGLNQIITFWGLKGAICMCRLLGGLKVSGL